MFYHLKDWRLQRRYELNYYSTQGSNCIVFLFLGQKCDINGQVNAGYHVDGAKVESSSHF